MTQRVLCPKHEEKTPSCVIYDNGYHCFGCGASGPLSDLNITVDSIRKTKKEDVASSIEKIKQLPVANIRGLKMHVDETHYYVLWPDNTYYKKRAKLGGPSKYLCPAGVSKPLFVAKRHEGGRLVIVEGEINALSLALVNPPYTVVSPGSCVELSSHKYVVEYKKYKNVVIVTDYDTPGVKGAIELKKVLLNYTPYVTIYTMQEDMNELLQEKGTDAVKEVAERLRKL